MTVSPVTIDGYDVTVEPGRMIWTDAAPRKARKLEECEIPSFAPLRARSYFTEQSVACRVEITGRTIQRQRGEPVVRIKITFVGDGEPDEVCRGWLVARGVL